MPIIVDAEPSLVVMQEELRRRNSAFGHFEVFKREYFWRQVFGRSEVWNPGGQSQPELQEGMLCESLEDRSVSERVAMLERWTDFTEEGAAARYHDRLVEDFAAAGITLRYLDVSITSDALAGLPGVPRTPAPVGIAPDIDVPDEDFCDLFHMAKAGRVAYTEWFVQAVAEEITTTLDDM